MSVAPALAAPAQVGGARALFGAAWAEWTKLRSLPSTWFLLGGCLVYSIGFSAVISYGMVRDFATVSAEEKAAFDPTATSLTSFVLGQLVFAAVAVLVITSEHTAGTIQASLAAVPRRGRLFAAKSVVAAAVLLVFGDVAAFGAFFAGQAAIASQGAPAANLGQPGVLVAVAASGLYLAVLGLLALALGSLLRSTAGTIALLGVVTLAIPALSAPLPDWLAAWLEKYWPLTAGTRIMAVRDDPGLLAPWTGFGVMCATVAVVLVIAVRSFRVRSPR
ncbi:ABC transporter permease [Nonomuraea zeae]|uniref:ABC transporter permease n=1 Tax=Nonomuraea zeae TaxID=1642303 RepID=A0A5S4GS29_9ACTN|nr:ABC transporter permease [Nonomuraea zeae]TMR35294.1 ABC transporter permease [Nonomuraea zeae]